MDNQVVEVYLLRNQTLGSDQPDLDHLLSIPIDDIQRLSTRPLKWLRFVMFCICGACGDLSATPGGEVVNYAATSLDVGRYYYKSEDSNLDTHMDVNGLNDRVKSPVATSCNPGFKESVKKRDGVCVITGEDATYCDAAHLIPKSKGDEHIKMVFRLRAPLYDPLPPTISSINAVENGVLLSGTLRSKLDRGAVAFLKTPNFAMDASDIPRIQRGSPDGDHITLHYLERPEEYNPDDAKRCLDEVASGRLRPARGTIFPGVHVDALFQGPANEEHLPPPVILDFMYGIAAYRRWKSPDGPIHDTVKRFFETHYKSPQHDSNDDNNEGSTSGDNSGSTEQSDSLEREEVLAGEMDEMIAVLMFSRGIPPEKAARRREVRMEEEERMAQEAGRAKVMGWRETLGTL